MPEPTLTKACRKCGVTRPAEDFPKRRGNRDGLYSYCRACDRADKKAWAAKNTEKLRAYRRQHYVENREQYLARAQMHKGIKNLVSRRRFPLAPEGWKFCTDCHYLLPLDEFYNDRSSKDGRTYRCKDCAKVASLASYYAAHERRLEQGRAYYEANKERLMAQQLEYARRFPQKYNLIKRSFRARERAGDGLPFTLRDILRIYKEQRGRCAYCSVPLRKVFELDHVVPISKGGGNEPGNVVCACPWCNENKRDLDADEFMRLHFRTT